MNLDMKTGAEAPRSKRSRAFLRGLEHREVPRPWESAAVYRRIRFMSTDRSTKE